MLRVWIILLVFCFCGSSYGQEPAGGSPETTAPTDATPPKSTQAANDSVPKQFRKDIWTDQKAMWTSPFHMNRRQWATIALPLAAARGGGAQHVAQGNIAGGVAEFRQVKNLHT